MNTPHEDIKQFESAFRRPLRRFQWFVWVMVVVMFAQSYFMKDLPLPRPIKLAIILGSAAFMLLGVFGFLWWLAPQHPLVKQMRPAARRYMARFLPAMLIYVAVFEAATWYYLRLHPTGLKAVLAGLAPSLPVLFAIRAMILFLKEESDEFLRSRMLESWSLATGLALALCTMWGFLDQFEVVPHLPLWAAFPIWAACLLPAHIIVQKRHS
jgi:hypothetical protein